MSLKMSVIRKNPFWKIYYSEEYKNVLLHRDNPADFPYMVDVELTNYCNLKCLFCPAAQAMTRKKGFMTEEVFKKVVDECAEHNTPVRFIRWGEPFLHPKIIKFAKYIKSKGLLLHITNNGLVITKRHMRAMIDLGLDSMIFSFQGATKEEYQRMRDNERYDDLVKNIKTLIKLRGKREKPFIAVSSTMHRDKEEDIKKFREYWEGIVDYVGIGKTKIWWMPARMVKIFPMEYRPCTEVYQKLSVDWDGKVTACCGDYDNFLTIGDIKENTLQELWGGEVHSAIRTLLDKGLHRSLTLCSKCTHSYKEF